MIYDSKYIIEKINKLLEDNKVLDENDLKQHSKDKNLSIEVLLSTFSELRLKLSEHMKLDKIIFLFGNGASIYAGSKDTRKFDITEFSDNEKYNQISDVIDKVQGSGIEEQLNNLITIRSYFKIMQDDREYIISKLIDEIKENLIKNYVNSIDYKNLNWHELFLLKLRSFGCLNKSSIYTPNYDLAFEYAMDELRIDYNDGFSGFVNRIFDPRTLTVKNKTSLIKIHGSVNWKIEDDKIKEFQPRFDNGKVIINDIAPVLIYPTSDKLYQTYAAPYSELMRHMLNELESGRNIVVVLGYKYGDEHINEILLKSFENPYNMYYFFLYTPDEKGNFIDKIKSLCQNQNIPNFNLLTGSFLASFDTFVNYIVPATPEKTDQEKMIELLKGVLKEND